MKRIKLFDKNLYIEALRQLRTIGVASGVILLLQSVLVPLSVFVTTRGINDEYVEEAELLNVAPLVFLVTLLLPIMTNILFSFVNKRNASDFYHSFPVRRETMYITYLAAVLTWGLGLLILPAAAEYLLFLPIRHVKLALDNSLYLMADILVVGVLISAAVIIAQCITGTRFGVLAVILMILFLPRLFLVYIREMVTFNHEFLLLDEGNHLFWDQSWNLLFGFADSYREMRSILYTLALALIDLIIGGVLFVKRKSEKAESVAISSRLQMVLRILPALTCSFLPIYVLLSTMRQEGFMDGSDIVILIILYIIVIVVYFLYELLTTRKLRSVVKAAPGLLWLAAANVAVLLFISLYGNYQAGLLPEAEEIDSVRFVYREASYGMGLFADESDYFDLRLQDITFDNDTINRIVSEALADTAESNGEYYESRYRLDVAITYNGRTIWRRIAFQVQQKQELLEAVIADARFFSFAEVLSEYDILQDVELYKNDQYSVLSQNKMRTIYQTAVEELALLDNKTQCQLLSEFRYPMMYATIEYQGDWYRVSLSIDQEMMPETWELIGSVRGNGFLLE